MSKKKIIAVLATLTLVAGLFAGCKPTETAPAPSTTGSSKPVAETKIKVGLSTDEGGLNDKSFNQAADSGVKKAQSEFKLDYKAIESKAKEDYETNLDALINDKADLVFGVGFQMETAMENIAKKYTDKKFALIDSGAFEDPAAKEPKQLKNVASYLFKANEASFLMGVIAGKMTKTNKVGFIGGKDFALINEFEAGFAAGVKAVNPKAAEGLISPDGKAFGATVKYADSFGDTNKGKELAKALIGSGCDVIYHAAGGVGEGMFQAVKEATDGGKKVWGIGVDMDQAATLPQYANYILSSALKRVDTATYEAAKSVVENKFQGGKIITLGLKEEGVGIAPSSNKNTPADVLELVNKYQQAVKDGKLTVPANRTDVKNFTAPEVK
jgi:basic membrane protein A